MWFRRRDRDWRSTLREFIYLDEISVTSLLAARDGEIPESVTNTLTQSAGTESKISASIPIQGLKLGTETRSTVIDTSAQEVVRRAVIQSTFRRLHTGGDRKNRPFGDGPSRESKFDATIRTTADFKRRSKTLTKLGAIKRLSDMARGDLIEFEVTLRPARTFVAAHALESIARIMIGRPQLFGDVAFQVQQVTPIADVLNDLMVGLVPLHGIGTNISLLEVDGHLHLVDARIFSEGSDIAARAVPVEIVAQTDLASYWKDLRRVLYSGSRYTVYARLSSAEVRHDWTALKLTELLQDVSQEMGASVAALETIIGSQFDSLSGKEEPVLDVRVAMHKFADALPGDVPEDRQTAIADAITVAVDQFRLAEGLASARAAFDIIIDAHEQATGVDVDRLAMTRVRTDVLSAADLEHAATILMGDTSAAKAPPSLEVDVIAIYW